MGTPDSREFDRLKQRGFKPYSVGHQQMYFTAVERMEASAKGARARIFEAGFGIGFGLQHMLARDVLEAYVGVEPNKRSYQYVAQDLGLLPDTRLALINGKFDDDVVVEFATTADDPEYSFDVAFCIEVIEHVPMDDQEMFLRNLKRMAPRLFFSTPDIAKSPKEGVRTTDEWVFMLTAIGFKVDVLTKHWTHLYECF